MLQQPIYKFEEIFIDEVLNNHSFFEECNALLH